MYKIISKKDKKVELQDLDTLEVKDYKIPVEKSDDFVKGDIVFFYDEDMIRVYKSALTFS